MGTVIQLQACPLPVEAATATRQREGSVGAEGHILFEPDVDNSRIASRIVPRSGVGNQLNSGDIIARHGSEQRNHVLLREVTLPSVDHHNYAIFTPQL